MRSPSALLLIDAIGAAFTALFTLLLLATALIPTGLPSTLLVKMGLVAAGFACFDAVALVWGVNPVLALRLIACANVGYALFAAASLFFYRSAMTGLGWAYYLIEIPILIGLGAWEWRIAGRAASHMAGE